MPCLVKVKSFATLEGDPESAKLTEHEFEDVLTALAEAELIVKMDNNLVKLAPQGLQRANQELDAMVAAMADDEEEVWGL